MLKLSDINPGNIVTYKGRKYMFFGTCRTKADDEWQDFAMYFGQDKRTASDGISSYTMFSRSQEEFEQLFSLDGSQFSAYGNGALDNEALRLIFKIYITNKFRSDED